MVQSSWCGAASGANARADARADAQPPSGHRVLSAGTAGRAGNRIRSEAARREWRNRRTVRTRIGSKNLSEPKKAGTRLAPRVPAGLDSPNDGPPNEAGRRQVTS